MTDLQTEDAVGPRPSPRGLAAVLPAVLLVLALTGAAAVTLRPVGDGWSWGSPVEEIRWYLGGLDSPATLRQLVGNVLLLVPATVAAVLLQPRVGSPRLLVAVGLAAGTSIEVLQWALPLGRVVSPTDAVLNASGVVLAGWATRSLPQPPAEDGPAPRRASRRARAGARRRG